MDERLSSSFMSYLLGAPSSLSPSQGLGFIMAAMCFYNSYL